jgi:hypothetical protein
VDLNLAYRWFCRLALEDAVPDHSTFPKNLHGYFRDNGGRRSSRMFRRGTKPIARTVRWDQFSTESGHRRSR